ncbi:MAG: NAD(P)H-hydrate dehydratase [Candidatus Daviesbacteria bacterium]|nr:NAD(P)H-hydrate dehydratase [Candidatus Daviesbacteria bacterium]
MNQGITELTEEWVVKRLPPRSKDANKGTFGKVLVIAGSKEYPGAAYLACAAAYRAGAGLVTLATEKETKIIISRKLSEATFLSRDEVLEKIDEYDVLLIGPGLGQSDQTVKLVEQILSRNLPPTVIDGDGLNILSKMEKWWERIDGAVVLTPHPGEMSRLTGLSIEEIQKNRLNTAQSFAKKWNQVVVLKGANTVIAPSCGGVVVSPFANPALATAGTGDVLSGVIAGLLAQGLDLFDAAGVGVYIHGLAGERIRKKTGNAGALANELLPLLPLVIYFLTKDYNSRK